MTGKANPLTDARRTRSEELAFGAEQAWATGKQAQSRKLFAEAAALQRVLVFRRVVRPGRQELERLVERCSREAELQQLSDDTAFDQLEVRLMGGCVGFGVAPAKSARERRESVTSLIGRVTDRTMIEDVEFDVTARGVAIGKQTLRPSHLPAPAKRHSSPTTRLHWNEVMREFLRRHDFTGTFLVLQRDALGNYQLLFSDVVPKAVTQHLSRRPPPHQAGVRERAPLPG